MDKPTHPNIQLLESLIRPNTRMIVLNNPNNLLGNVFSGVAQCEIAALPHLHCLILLVDEIVRPLFHDAEIESSTSSFVELAEGYQNIVVTGSLSKAWGLPGARVGWIVTRNAFCSLQGVLVSGFARLKIFVGLFEFILHFNLRLCCQLCTP